MQNSCQSCKDSDIEPFILESKAFGSCLDLGADLLVRST